ncbi:hypothetical protein SCP_1203020 [Sparassis crispa]|uniref:Uncharacterized protein n=1 Tax=Sparassis crispa TaxID=139825 RepID=A0A401H0Z9_9APHY|nr:hypothetical protein SCP_1203020 [Sparassis crispa]GBE88073.1 hypothetical protein SCP_1203020 [Sparassis crispa]
MLRARTLRYPVASDFPRPSGLSERPAHSATRIILRRPRRIRGYCQICSWVVVLLILLGSGFWLRLVFINHAEILRVLRREPSANNTTSSASYEYTLGETWHGQNLTKPFRAPLVDRSVIQKLALLHIEDQDEDEDEQPEVLLIGPSPRPRWPPTVTALPESRPTGGIAASRPPSGTRAGQSTEEVDSQFCTHGPCRLLMPLALSAREPKLQAHLTQLLQLARALNRTLVLPNVGRGRAGACLRWEFSVYFDIASMVRAGGTSVMLLDDFRTWVDVRPRVPAAQFVSIDADEPDLGLGLEPMPENAIFTIGDRVRVDVDDALDLDDVLLRSARCLKPKFRRLNLETFSPLSVHLAPFAGRLSEGGDVSAGLVEALSRKDVKLAALEPSLDPFGELNSFSDPDDAPPQPDPGRIMDPEVLLVNWDMQLLPFSTAPLQYSRKLWALADKLATPLGPYLAVHWRMEKVSPEVLPACAEALVDTLDMLLRDESLAGGVEAVWFTSDYPYPVSWSSSREQSSPEPTGKARSLRTLKREHKEAIDIVRTAFEPGGDLNEWRITGLVEELAHMRGLLDILEKMVAMKATLFVSSAKGCGRVAASAKQIVDFRTHTRAGDIPNNVVTLFG